MCNYWMRGSEPLDVFLWVPTDLHKVWTGFDDQLVDLYHVGTKRTQTKIKTSFSFVLSLFLFCVKGHFKPYTTGTTSLGRDYTSLLLDRVIQVSDGRSSYTTGATTRLHLSVKRQISDTSVWWRVIGLNHRSLLLAETPYVAMAGTCPLATLDSMSTYTHM